MPRLSHIWTLSLHAFILTWIFSNAKVSCSWTETVKEGQLNILGSSAVIDYSLPFNLYPGDPAHGWVIYFAPATPAVPNNMTIIATRSSSAHFSFNVYGKSVEFIGNSSCNSQAAANDTRPLTTDVQLTTGVGTLGRLNLDLGLHTVRVDVQCTGGAEFSLESAMVDGWLGSSGSVGAKKTHIDDSDADLNSSFQKGWTTRGRASTDPTVFGNTTHASTNTGSTFAFNFNDNAIAIYGAADQLGSYTVTLDGQTHEYQAHPFATGNPSALLFFAAGLDGGKPHNLALTNVNASGLNIDYVATWRPSKAKFSRGAIGGIVVGALIAFIIAALILFCLINDRRRPKEDPVPNHSSAFPLPFPYPHSPMTSARHSCASSHISLSSRPNSAPVDHVAPVYPSPDPSPKVTSNIDLGTPRSRSLKDWVMESPLRPGDSLPKVRADVRFHGESSVIP